MEAVLEQTETPGAMKERILFAADVRRRAALKVAHTDIVRGWLLADVDGGWETRIFQLHDRTSILLDEDPKREAIARIIAFEALSAYAYHLHRRTTDGS